MVIIFVLLIEYIRSPGSAFLFNALDYYDLHNFGLFKYLLVSPRGLYIVRALCLGRLQRLVRWTKTQTGTSSRHITNLKQSILENFNIYAWIPHSPVILICAEKAWQEKMLYGPYLPGASKTRKKKVLKRWQLAGIEINLHF